MVTSNAVVGSSAIISLGIARKCDSYHNALSHTSGQLVRIVVDDRFRHRNAHELQHLYSFGARLRLGGKRIDKIHDFFYLIADGEYGVKACHRFLEYHRYILSAYASHIFGRHLANVVHLVLHLVNVQAVFVGFVYGFDNG